LPLGPETAAIDPGDPAHDRRIVDQKPCLEIVRAVDDHVHAIAELLDVRVIDVGHDRLDRDQGVCLAQLFGRRDRLGQLSGDIGFVEQQLPLEVVGLDEIPVDDPHPTHPPPHPPAGPPVAHPRPHQQAGQHVAQRPAATHQGLALAQPPLALLAQRRVAHLADVAIEAARCVRHCCDSRREEMTNSEGCRLPLGH
jgi:hypothetical protein